MSDLTIIVLALLIGFFMLDRKIDKVLDKITELTTPENDIYP